MDIYATFRRINIVCLYALAALGIVWLAGGMGLGMDDIIALSGLAAGGVVYFHLLKLFRSHISKSKSDSES